MWTKTTATTEMRKNLEKIKTFCIVIRDNERSEYYFNKIKDSWTEVGINLERIDATTPDTIDPKFEFEEQHYAEKYQIKGVVKAMSPTEKAVLVSHIRIWKQIVKGDIQNNLVLEHDALLENVELFYDWYFNKKEDVRFYGLGASCYSISPRAAKQVLTRIDRDRKHLNLKLNSGPMAYIAPQPNQNHKMHNYPIWYAFKHFHAKEHPVSHIFDRDVGSSIDHYPTEDLKPFKEKSEQRNASLWRFLDEER